MGFISSSDAAESVTFGRWDIEAVGLGDGVDVGDVGDSCGSPTALDKSDSAVAEFKRCLNCHVVASVVSFNDTSDGVDV